MFKVTRTFLKGHVLEGLTYTEVTSVRYTLGKVYTECLTRKKYRITSIENL